MARSVGRAVDMGDGYDDMIRQLCTIAGMLMEDAAPIAVSMPAMGSADFVAALDRIGRAGRAVDYLVRAVGGISALR